MVYVTFFTDIEKRTVSLRVEGHAGQADKGHDIVCASASILAYTVAQTVKNAQERGILRKKPVIRIKNGDAAVTCSCKDDGDYQEMLHAYMVIQTGYRLLAANYKDFVSPTPLGESVRT